MAINEETFNGGTFNGPTADPTKLRANPQRGTSVQVRADPARGTSELGITATNGTGG